jgi:hypothetical protein
MAKAKARTKTARTAADPSELLERARTLLVKEGVVKLSALGPPAAREHIVAELVKQGFELTKSSVRQPISAQLTRALAEGAFIPLKAIGSHVAGASAGEAKQAALALVMTGGAKLVLRGTEEVVVPPTTAVLSREQLLRFSEVASEVAKAAKSKSGASLLQADLLEKLQRVAPEIGAGIRVRASRTEAATATRKETTARDGEWSRLLSAVEATRDPETGLSFVPAIVATLKPVLGPETTAGVLLAAAKAGLLELRPEGGIHRLSDDELAACPEGPHGTRLSWARRTETVAR